MCYFWLSNPEPSSLYYQISLEVPLLLKYQPASTCSQCKHHDHQPQFPPHVGWTRNKNFGPKQLLLIQTIKTFVAWHIALPHRNLPQTFIYYGMVSRFRFPVTILVHHFFIRILLIITQFVFNLYRLSFHKCLLLKSIWIYIVLKITEILSKT